MNEDLLYNYIFKGNNEAWRTYKTRQRPYRRKPSLRSVKPVQLTLFRKAKKERGL